MALIKMFLANEFSFFTVVWLTNERRLALFPAEIIVSDPYHRDSPTRRE